MNQEIRADDAALDRAHRTGGGWVVERLSETRDGSQDLVGRGRERSGLPRLVDVLGDRADTRDLDQRGKAGDHRIHVSSIVEVGRIDLRVPRRIGRAKPDVSLALDTYEGVAHGERATYGFVKPVVVEPSRSNVQLHVRKVEICARLEEPTRLGDIRGQWSAASLLGLDHVAQRERLGEI